MRKRVCIDINSIVPLKSMGYLTGVGRTTFELVKEIDRLKDELPFDIVLYLQNIRGITPADFGISLPYKNLYLPFRDYINKFISPVHIRTALTRYDLWHCPHNSDYVDNVSKTIFTMHDMLMYTYPAEFSPEAHKKFENVVLHNMRSCRAVITCSQSTKNDIVRYIGINPDKIHVIYWGINHHLFKPYPDKEYLKDKLAKKFAINNPYFFSVSCGYKRKNTIELIHAYNDLAKQNPVNDLVLVWNHYGKDVEELLKKNSRIHILKNISDEDLMELYNGATATYFPSKYEGFGLPVLESMACGIPVVTCKNSSLTEVGGDIAFYVKSEDAQGILETMENMENETGNRESLILQGIQYASRFTWEKCAKQTIAVYNKYLL